MSLFTKLYISGWLFLITVELIGVFWNFHDLDTMTSTWRYLTTRMPWMNIVLTVGLVALWVHLVEPWKWVKQWTS